jgi:hypothetical protein
MACEYLDKLRKFFYEVYGVEAETIYANQGQHYRWNGKKTGEVLSASCWCDNSIPVGKVKITVDKRSWLIDYPAEKKT